MTRTTISRLTSLLAAVALAACGSGSSGPGGPGSVGGPGPAAALAITASPTQPVTAGEPFTATVEVRDARGNLVTAGLEQISLTLQGGDPAAALGGTTSAQSVLGEAAFADLTVERAADGYRLVASAPGLADASSGEFRIVAAAAAPGSSAVAAAAATQTAGQDVAITATVLDLFGNPVEGATVAFATAASDATFVQPSPTDPSGVATGSVRSTRAEAVTVRGSIGGGPDFAGTATVTFEPGAPSAVASTLAASPTAVDADGTSAISLTATVKDEHGNPVPGATVTLASSGDASFVQPGPTDASGVALGAIRSTAVGQQTVTPSRERPRSPPRSSS
jgi:adhesin/invasin